MGPPFDGPCGRDDVLRRIADHPLGGTVAEMRRDFRRLAVGGADPAAAIDRRARVVDHPSGLAVAPAGGSRGLAIWLHGGGYVFGAPETHLRPAARLAAGAGCTVVLPRYPLAPEARWPAQRDHALAAIDAQDAPPVLVGDSAGGHLALVAALACARRGRPVAGLALMSPNTDRTGRNAERSATSAVDPMVDDAGDATLARMAFGPDHDPTDPQVSPLGDDLTRLPATHLEVGTPEVLRLDSVLLAEAATRQGADVALVETPGLIHMGQLWTPWWDAATASLDRVAAFVARRLDGHR